MNYMVIRCPKCHQISTAQCSDEVLNGDKFVFKCKLCRKSTKLFDKRHNTQNYRVLFLSNLPGEATKVCQELKKRQVIGNVEVIDEY